MTKELLEQISQEIVELARGLPRKVFAISCWKNTRFDPDIPEEVYASTTKALLENTLGLVRYEVTNPFSSIFLRTQNVRNHFQGSSAMIFASREEALAEVRRREQQEIPNDH